VLPYSRQALPRQLVAVIDLKGFTVVATFETGKDLDVHPVILCAFEARL